MIKVFKETEGEEFEQAVTKEINTGNDLLYVSKHLISLELIKRIKTFGTIDKKLGCEYEISVGENYIYLINCGNLKAENGIIMSDKTISDIILFN